MKEGSGKTKQISKLVDWEVGGAIYRRTRFGAMGDMISFGYVEIKAFKGTQVDQVVKNNR